MKKIIVFIITLSILATVFNAAAASTRESVGKGPGIFINGEKLELAQKPVIVSGRTLVPARVIFEEYGAEVKWYPISSSVKITAPDTMMSMRIGSNSIYVNERPNKTDVAPKLLNGVTMVPLRFIAETMNSQVDWDPSTGNVSISTSEVPADTSRGETDRAHKVVIDAGHGGSQVGANYFGKYEKNLNLDIAKTLNELLQAEGIKTYMTRTGDSNISLYDRSELANGVDADLLISVHNNAGKASEHGVMTLYYPGGTMNSNGGLTAKELAQTVQNELAQRLGARNIGIISRPNLAVLRVANMPAVIAEVGYMSNRAEMDKLNNKNYRFKAAEALKDAVLKALKQI